MAARTSQHLISSRAPTSGSFVEELELDESDFIWDAEVSERPARRESMPTLPDWDPLRHDLAYSRGRDVTRDSMPTLPDFDPLRHDSEAPPGDQLSLGVTDCSVTRQIPTAPVGRDSYLFRSRG